MNPIALPRWMLSTRTMDLSSVDVVLIFALVLHNHGTADAIRATAKRIRDKVCMEHRPKMRLLANTEDDARVLQAAINIVERSTSQLGILPGRPFPVRGMTR